MNVKKSEIVSNSLWLGHNEVFKLDDKTVIKFIKNIEEYSVSLEVQYGLFTPAIVYPKEKVFEDGKYIGYTMDFVDGVVASKHSYNDLEELIKCASILEESIRITSEKHLFIYDLRILNTLFSEIIKVIDTTMYKHYENVSVETIRQFNYKAYNDFMLTLLDKANNFNKNDLYKACMISANLFKYHELFFFGHIPFSELLLELKDKTKVKTLQELKKYRTWF